MSASRNITRTVSALFVFFAASRAWADPQEQAPPQGNTPLPPSPDESHDHHDHDHDHEHPSAEVTVRADRAGSEAASRITVSRRDLELRPRLRPGDILEAAPGLFAVQHAGGGKANQYFLRGFDADHGTDVGFFVDGVPINMPSHGHGQGWTDFHFLIPELVVSLDAYKGPYYAQFGDFSTAGALNLRLAERFEESRVSLTVGEYNMLRGLVIASPDLADDWRTVLAAEMYGADGPFQNPEKFRRFNVFARATHDLGPRSSVSMTWMSYGGQWNASGQIPARAVCGEGESGVPAPGAYGQPCMSRFGTVDPSEGGSTQRHMASISFSTAAHDSDLSAMAYFINYRFQLYSNFTFFEKDPIHGDEIEQTDQRSVFGADVRARRHVHYGASRFTTTFGAQARHDSIDNALYHDEARERLETQKKHAIEESSLGLFVEEDVRLTNAIRFVAALRADRFDVSVEDKREDLSSTGNKSSGTDSAMLLSPKLMFVISPTKWLDLFADYGRGFHSNDARGAVLSSNRVNLLTPATGYEIGAKAEPLAGWQLYGAGFLLDLASELVWVGDEGTTEASGQTRRYGVELGSRYRIGNWFYADADLTFTRARYRVNAGNGDAVALAPTRTFTAGVGARPTFGRFTPFGGIRLKHIGDRPANEDASLTAQGFTLVDADAGLRWGNVEGALDVQNLLNSAYREVNFATTTRLRYEPAPVTGIHYSPGWPRTVMARATLYWQ
ncbi:MAG: TonB-dependent receptor [Polyangiaceae bacterium]